MAKTHSQFSTQPFQPLRELEAHAAADASHPPPAPETAQSWSGVGFRLGQQRYVVPFDEVSEVLYELRYTSIPGVKPWVKGLANVRGRLLPVVDLNGLLDDTLSVPSKMRRLIVLEHGEIFVGFVVDEVYGMQHFLLESYQAQATAAPAKAQPYIHGAFVNQHSWHVFSLEQLIQSPEFFAVVA